MVFIGVPRNTEGGIRPHIHSAEVLAHQYEYDDPGLFHYEFVVEWAIPRAWVRHKVSLKTLMARGLGWEKYFPVGLPQQISLEDLRLAEASIDRRYAPLWEIGLSMASIALHFGTRAPMRWMIEQLFHDLFKPKYYETSSSLRLRCNNGSLEIGIEEFWEEFNEGVDFVLVDWLTDPNLLQGFEEYEEERSAYVAIDGRRIGRYRHGEYRNGRVRGRV
ncbi:hypothetical protein PG987_004827 [Apiospora arundinis]